MNNISKLVVAQKEGKKIGFCLDIALDEKLRKTGYYVVDEESEEEFFVKSEDFLSTSESTLLVKSCESLEFVGERSGVLGKEILTDECENLGIVHNIVFQNDKCVKLATEKCEIPAKFVQSWGKEFVFVSFKRKKNRKNEKKLFEHINENIIVQIQDFQKEISPEKVRLSASYYVGKVANQDIFGFNNEKVVSSGQVITRAIVEKAKKHNRLNQLFFAIKR